MGIETRQIRVLALLALAGGPMACTQFPELDAVQTPGVATAPYPELLPLGELLGGARPEVSAETITRVEGRVGALQARADRLRGTRIAPSQVDDRLARLRRKADELRSQ